MNKNSEKAENAPVLVDFSNNDSLRSKGISFHWWSGDTTQLHSHNFYEFFIITEGAARHEINGITDIVKKGALTFIRPEDCHKITSESEPGCIHMNISIRKQKLEAICEALGTTLDTFCQKQNRSVLLSVDELRFFKSRAKRMNMLEHNGIECDFFFAAELVMEAVSILLSSDAEADMQCPQWFTTILEKIHSPSFYACTAADVYRLGNFSPPVMIEYFKKYTGKTVNEYIRELKMAIACDCLKTTDMPVVELSNMLGYTSLSHFNRIFKKYTSQTPAAYRKGRPGEK